MAVLKRTATGNIQLINNSDKGSGNTLQSSSRCCREKTKVHSICFARIGQRRMGWLGVIPASLLGVASPLCMYGTIPLLQQWLVDGMSMGSAAAFMITGPATKITNLGAMKIVLGWKRFMSYILFTMVFAWGTGMIVDLLT